MFLVYGFCNASFRGVCGGKRVLVKRGKVSVRDVDSINVLKNGMKLKVF